MKTIALVLSLIAFGAEAQHDRIKMGFMVTSNHISNPAEGSRTDCTADFVGGGGWLEFKTKYMGTIELEGALGGRLLRCFQFSGTAPGGYASMKIKFGKR